MSGLARVIIIRDNSKYAVPDKYKPRFSTQRGNRIDHRTLVEDFEQAYPRLPGGSRYFAARGKRHTIPEFTQRLEDQWHHHDDTVSLRVGFNGYPDVVVTWFKDQQPILPDMHHMIVTSEYSSELTIMSAQKAEAGFYSVRIENSMGVRESHCQVYIGDNERLKSKGNKTLLANSRLYRSAIYKPNAYYNRF
uniref:Ig-like domain-containing protein n=1 Tax=Panagrellus redivivus TaxID=6233 RepID=A0A7E4V6J8_PANRE